MSRMHDRNVFHDAIDDYLDTEAQSFYATYKDADPRSIAISPMLRSLLLVKARQAGMRVMTDELAVDSANCDRRLRASLAYRFFGIGAWHRVYRERDQDLEAAIEQLEAARAMAEAQGVN